MKAITSETLYDFRFVSAPSFSPDGKSILYFVKYADKAKNGYSGDAWLCANGTSRRLTGRGNVMTAVWDTDGTVLFPAAVTEAEKKAAADGEEVTAYYRIDPKGGEALYAFTIPAKVMSLLPLGEGRYAVHYMHDRAMEQLEGLTGAERAEKLKEIRDPAYYQITDYPFWNNGRGVTSGTRGGAGLFSAADGSWETLCDPEFEVLSLKAGDGYLVYTGAPIIGRRAPFGAAGVYVYDIAEEQETCLIRPGAVDLGAVEPWGEDVMVMYSECVEWGNSAYADFHLINRCNGADTLLCTYDRSAGHGSVGSDARFGAGRGMKAVGDTLYFLTIDEDICCLRSLTKQGMLSDMLTPPGSCDAFDICGDAIVTCGMYGNRLSDLYFNGARITDFGDTSEYTVSTPERFDIGSDGTQIHGWVMKPVQPAEHSPAILNIHGGPRTIFGDVFFHEMQVWANAGYYVFYCNPRGSDGRGDEFGDLAGKYGTIDYDDLMRFTDAVLEAFPQIDRSRVGVTGGSYGGYMTNWIVGHTDRFAAAASQRSITNWVTYEYTSDIGLDFVKMDLKANTDENLPLVLAQSPLPFAKNCKTPILFIHSDHDHRCWMSEGITMFTAVKKAGCDARLCLFRDENHELSRSGKPKNRISRMNEILNWMDRYLKG